jgi:hypothetical protein
MNQKSKKQKKTLVASTGTSTSTCTSGTGTSTGPTASRLLVKYYGTSTTCSQLHRCGNNDASSDTGTCTSTAVLEVVPARVPVPVVPTGSTSTSTGLPVLYHSGPLTELRRYYGTSTTGCTGI